MKYDIMLAGVGGQGVLSLAALIGRAAVAEGLQVKQSEVHGMAQRGGAVLSHLRLADHAIASDLIPLGTADMILSMEPLESLRYLDYLSPDAAVVTATDPFVNIPDYPPREELLERLGRLPRAVPVVELNEIFRQASQSAIIVAAHRINEGAMPDLRSSRERIEDFYFIEQSNPEEVHNLILRLCTERIPERFGLDPMEDIQVLSPMHRGIVGTEQLNIALQQALNPETRTDGKNTRVFRRLDRVMQVLVELGRQLRQDPGMPEFGRQKARPS